MTGQPFELPTSLQLPASYLLRARQLAKGEIHPAQAKPAATVVLVRDGADGLEVFLLRRVATMAFAAGMHVFPGGSVDPADAGLPEDAWAGPPAIEWSRILAATEDLARGLVCAAVRETFEESGVLLAGPSAGEVVSDTTDEGWEEERQQLLRRNYGLASLLHGRGLLLRSDLLRAWAHWITPEVEERRYDTRFFVAALPEGQRTRDVGGESDRVHWLPPQEALLAHRRGELGMLPPTAFTLAELSAYDRVADVLAAGAVRDIQPRLPRVVVDADSARLLLPHGDS
ncbi:MAG: NUDIX hydrolase [Mycobacteriales bacterium]